MKTAATLTVLISMFLALPAVAQQATREDFKEFCEAFQGRWVGDVVWVADWEGFGKKGDKVTAYAEHQLAEDGHVLVTRFFGGAGSGTGIVFFDAGANRIRWHWVSSAGGTSQSVMFKKDGKWHEESVGSNPDGTKTKYRGSVTVSDEGNTHRWSGKGSVGDEPTDEHRDVWRRVSK